MKMLKEHNDKNAAAHENSGTETSDDEEFKPKESDENSQTTNNGYKSEVGGSSSENESETEDLKAEIGK
jgi:hypothetical protein